MIDLRQQKKGSVNLIQVNTNCTIRKPNLSVFAFIENFENLLSYEDNIARSIFSSNLELFPGAGIMSIRSNLTSYN